MEGLSLDTVRVSNNSRLASICIVADLGMQWHIAQQRHALAGAPFPRSCREWSARYKSMPLTHHTIQTKDIMIVTAVGAGESAHVLHHTKYGHLDFLEEVETSGSIA
jgi:hypothetical protein